jgi:hypothetical protein
MLNSVEMLWNQCKRRLRNLVSVNDKKAFVERLITIVNELNQPNKVRGMWRFAITNWLQRIEQQQQKDSKTND